MGNSTETNSESAEFLADTLDNLLNGDEEINTSPKEENVDKVQEPSNEIIKEIAKVEIEIEKLSEINTIDTSDFYDNLDKHLNEEEEQLEFDNKSEYLKLIAKKEKEYIASKSKDKEILELKEKKAELEDIKNRQISIASVQAKYPQYNHEVMMDFFKKELSANQQNKIYNASKTFEDVYENTYSLYLDLNKQTVKHANHPNIPNVSGVRKQSIDANDIAEHYTSDNDKLRDALGV